MVCLGNEQRSFCHLWDCTQVLHFGLLLTMMATPFPLRDSYPQYELNSPIPVHFSLPIPKMSTFTLAISCLTISNLPWFMDLTFQVLMQYCSLYHWTLLLSPVTSTTGYRLQKINEMYAFELWCWIRLLRVPWTARRSNQSILKEISPGCSLERLMLKLKLQYFGHLMRRVDSLEKTLMLGGIGGRRRRGR